MKLRSDLINDNDNLYYNNNYLVLLCFEKVNNYNEKRRK